MDAARILSRAGRLRLLALASALPLTGAAFAAGAPQVVGIAAAVLNEVGIAPGGAAQLQPAVLRQRVALADRVQTGQRSQLQRARRPVLPAAGRCAGNEFDAVFRLPYRTHAAAGWLSWGTKSTSRLAAMMVPARK